MPVFYVKAIEVQKLWGYKDIKLNFNKDVNIIIGRNASGKTTSTFDFSQVAEQI